MSETEAHGEILAAFDAITRRAERAESVEAQLRAARDYADERRKAAQAHARRLQAEALSEIEDPRLQGFLAVSPEIRAELIRDLPVIADEAAVGATDPMTIAEAKALKLAAAALEALGDRVVPVTSEAGGK